MGSKRVMLQNGLGTLIREESKNAKRIVDLFCGAGSVVKFSATETRLPILAVDLQQYSVVLAKAILGRITPIISQHFERTWLSKIDQDRSYSMLWKEAKKLPADCNMRFAKRYVEECRDLCTLESGIGPIWNAYGGYYFSPEQALTFDYMLSRLPQDEADRAICQASLIITAMRCAAAPGHTAQPFQPTPTAKKFIIESWKRDPLDVCKRVLAEICPQHAHTLGEAKVADAVKEARRLKPTDLVVVDPPYSGVQYSRFYHVLETLSRGKCGPVSGVGRYPGINERPQSAFSNAGQSKEALTSLLRNLSSSEATVIFTFPEGECSNGLSGDVVTEEAQKYFKIKEKKVVPCKFSTLGGNNKKNKRKSRQDSCELILLMKPKVA